MRRSTEEEHLTADEHTLLLPRRGHRRVSTDNSKPEDNKKKYQAGKALVRNK